MVDLLRFEDYEKARSPRRLVLFNHIPKTGGTTLAYILKSGLDLTHFPLYKRYAEPHQYAYEPGTPAYFALEDYRDWARLRDHPTLHTAPDILAEGNVWGAENLVRDERKVFYVTILRDPFKVFRSNYGYLVRHKHLTNTDLESFLDSQWEPDFLTRHIGNGDLDLAIERLEHVYSVFGVTEHYKETARLVGGFFGFSVDRYMERNKSKSEQFELPAKAARRFEEANRNDNYLYKYAEELFLRRIEEAPFLADIPDADDIVEERTEESYRATIKRPYDSAAIQEALGRNDYAGAIREITTQENVPIGHVLTLARCHQHLGELDKAKAAYLEAFDWRASENIGPVLNFLIEHFPEDLIKIAEREIGVLENLIFDKPADTFTYHNLVAYTNFLASGYIKLGRYHDAIALLDRELERMLRRGLCGVVGGYYDSQYATLTGLKVKALERLAPDEADRIIPEVIRHASQNGQLHNYPWRQIAKYAPLQGAPILANRAIRRLRRAF